MPHAGAERVLQLGAASAGPAGCGAGAGLWASCWGTGSTQLMNGTKAEWPKVQNAIFPAEGREEDEFFNSRKAHKQSNVVCA